MAYQSAESESNFAKTLILGLDGMDVSQGVTPEISWHKEVPSEEQLP